MEDSNDIKTEDSISSVEAVPSEPEPAIEEKISIDDFLKVEVKVGKVVLCEKVPETDKLLRLLIDVGESEPRQIISGISDYVSEPDSLIGKELCFVTNLKPRMLKGLRSDGMLFAVGEGDTFAFLTPDRVVPPGTSAH